MNCVERAGRKALGAFYTPPELVRAVLSKLKGPFARILEPSCGDGAFAIPAARRFGSASIDACDIDGAAVDAMMRKTRSRRISARRADFLLQWRSFRKGYDLILGNPPYVRHRMLSPAQKEACASVYKAAGLKPDGLCNAWDAFFIASALLLRKGGIMALILPDTFLKSAHAARVRGFASSAFRSVTLARFQSPAFSGACQNTVAFIARRGAGDGRVRLLDLPSFEALEKADLSSIPFRYAAGGCLPDPGGSLLGLLRCDPRAQELGSMCRIKQGLVTGCDRFFCLTRKQAEAAGICGACRPILCSGAAALGAILSISDLDAAEEAGIPNLLFRPESADPADLPANWRAWIEWGEGEGCAEHFKCRIRDPWWLVPSPGVPPLFIPTASWSHFRMIRNACGATSTSCMLQCSVPAGVDPAAYAVMAFNSLTLASAEASCMAFSGGLLGVNPGPASRVLAPCIGVDQLASLAPLLPSLDAMERAGRALDLLAEFDELILGRLAGFAPAEIIRMRELFHELRQKRRARGRKADG